MAGEAITDPDGPSSSALGALSHRTVSWHDPRVTAATVYDRSGLETLRDMRDGISAHPPMMEVLGIRLARVEFGDVDFSCTPDDSAYNRLGSIHGGLLCTLLDSAIGCAVGSTLAAGVEYTSLEIKVNYIRRAQGGTTLLTHGWVVKPGRRVAFAEGDIRGADGKVIATGSGSCLVMGGG